MAVLPGVIKSVLEAENSYIRFENFCLDIIYSAEGIELAPTSITRDAGRDGRAILLSLAPARPILCATTTPGIDSKVTHDMIRLVQTTKTEEIIYCLSKSISEEKCISMETKIRELYPEAKSVRVLSQVQIARLIEHHEDIFRKHYAAEIRNVERALLIIRDATPDVAELGLRLALCTQAGDDASFLRKELSRCLVLSTLSESGQLKANQIASSITHQLHLPQSISEEYTLQIINQLSEDGLVLIDNGVVKLTDLAESYLQKLSEQAGIKLLEGRESVRTIIEKLSGNRLADLHFEKIWDVFQDGISHLFYSHGMQIIRMVRSTLDEKDAYSTKYETYFPIENLADRIASLFTQSSQANEVRQAIIDMFTEKDSPAFQWLTQLCSIFVMMCSLGLESISSDQIIKTLSSYHLVPDSDIVISLLCEGEGNHEDVNKIIKGWKAISGNIYIAKPVLEEVAYHAWISEYDYSYFEHELSKLSDEKAKYVIENAFVRTFKKVSGELTARKYWSSYINQYKGRTQKDYSRIYQVLNDEFQFELLPESDYDNGSLREDIKAFMIEKVASWHSVEPQNLDYRAVNKIDRDIQLILAVLSERKKQLQSLHLTSTCIISSANLLRETTTTFRKFFGEPDVVLSTAAVAFLLTLTPQVRMSFGTLRSILFDTGLSTRLHPAQRYAYRIITASAEHDFPWSKRVTLQRELREVILQDARSMGEPISKLQDRFIKAKDQAYVAHVTANVIDRLALTPKREQELIETKAKLAKSEAELVELKESFYTTIKKKPKRQRFKSKKGKN